jgi:hypothetical protein
MRGETQTRHCEERSDEAIQRPELDCFVALLLAMTNDMVIFNR